MIIENLNTYNNPGTMISEDKMYKLDELKQNYKNMFFIKPNCFLFIDSDEVQTEYAFFQFCWSEFDDTNIHVSKIFHGCGTTYDRAMKHTYFGDKEGYIFYLPIDETIKSMEILKKYFD